MEYWGNWWRVLAAGLGTSVSQLAAAAAAAALWWPGWWSHHDDAHDDEGTEDDDDDAGGGGGVGSPADLFPDAAATAAADGEDVTAGICGHESYIAVGRRQYVVSVSAARKLSVPWQWGAGGP